MPCLANNGQYGYGHILFQPKVLMRGGCNYAHEAHSVAESTGEIMTQTTIEQLVAYLDNMKPFIPHPKHSTPDEVARLEHMCWMIDAVIAALTAQAGDGNRLPLEEVPEGWRLQKILSANENTFEVWLINTGEWRHWPKTRQPNYHVATGATPAEALRAAIEAAKDGES